MDWIAEPLHCFVVPTAALEVAQPESVVHTVVPIAAGLVPVEALLDLIAVEATVPSPV